MSTLHGRAHIGADGTFSIPLPAECANSEVEFTLQFHIPGANGKPRAAITSRRRMGDERRMSLRRLSGSLDDPTFSRPSQGEHEPLEPME